MEDVWGCVAVVGVLAVFAAFVTLSWMLGWNYLAPTFHMPTLNYIQSAMFLLMVSLTSWVVGMSWPGPRRKE